MKTPSLAFLAAFAVCAMACSRPFSLQETLLTNDKQIDEIIAQMSLEEKVEMLHSKTLMSSEGIPRLGIQEIRYADGPFGIREELGDGFRPLGLTTDSATYYPTGSALAATWSADLAYKYGEAMGTEARRRGKDVILGPAINIQRLPVGGRTYEYFSEDPILSSALAVGYTKGSQAAGTAVCLKHFAMNNQETNRGNVNVIIDPRPMREIYLKPFEAAVKEGGAMVVMPAYNKVNGYWCSENDELCNKILREEWGFNGFTVSDWGGTHSTLGAALGGLCVQMTGDNYLGPALIDSVRVGIVPEAIVDAKVREILRVRFAIEQVDPQNANIEAISQIEQQQVAYEVAQKSIVLLKNENKILPIDKQSVKKIAVVGINATASTANGGVGAGVKTIYEISPLQGIVNELGSDVEVLYAPGYKYIRPRGMWGPLTQDDGSQLDSQLLNEAIDAAQSADLVIFFAGTNKQIETEGSDRKNIMLPGGQDELIAHLASVNDNIVSVLISGGPCDLNEVVKYSTAVVQGWWNGLEGGHALADVLFGRIAPSGKLPFTFPIRLEDSPAYAMGNFPQKSIVGTDVFTAQYRQDITGGQSNQHRERPNPDAYYSEGSLVGYRWFDTKQMEVMFPFGHGLSYVDFDYSNISTDKKTYKAKDIISVSFDIKNVGQMEADEVVQLYVHRIDANVEWPQKELKAFERVNLQSGQTKNITLEIPVCDLSYWNEEIKDWSLEKCKIEILVGSSSRDIRLQTEIPII